MLKTKPGPTRHFHLVARLERYEEHAALLVERWLDPALYRRVSHEMEALVLEAVSLPALAASALALRIAHAELFAGLWRQCDRKGAPTVQAPLLARHSACVDALRRSCVRQLKAA